MSHASKSGHDDDEIVPFEHANRIKAACPEATLWKIEGYEHVGACAHPKYPQRILSFLRTEVFAGKTLVRSQPTRSRLAMSSFARGSLVVLRDVTL